MSDLEQHLKTISDKLHRDTPHPDLNFLKNQADQVYAIIVGETIYQTRQPCQTVIRKSGGGWRFKLDLPLDIQGQGKSREEATLAWIGIFHSTFQRLWYLDIKDQTWEDFAKCIDIEAYAQIETLTLVQVGIVKNSTATRKEVYWLDEDKPESISIEQMPGPMTAFPCEKRFEAVVRREAQTWRLLEVIHATLLPDLDESSKAAFTRVIQNAPGTNAMGQEVRENPTR